MALRVHPNSQVVTRLALAEEAGSKRQGAKINLLVHLAFSKIGGSLDKALGRNGSQKETLRQC